MKLFFYKLKKRQITMRRESCQHSTFLALHRMPSLFMFMQNFSKLEWKQIIFIRVFELKFFELLLKIGKLLIIRITKFVLPLLCPYILKNLIFLLKMLLSNFHVTVARKKIESNTMPKSRRLVCIRVSNKNVNFRIFQTPAPKYLTFGKRINTVINFILFSKTCSEVPLGHFRSAKLYS